MDEGHDEVDSLEVRVVEVKSALDVGMAEIKGSLALLVQSSEYTKAEFARRDAERVADWAAQAKKDEDQEKRLRVLEHKVYMAMGTLTLITTGGVLLHFVH